jgi:predicted HTH transcriptional regulator
MGESFYNTTGESGDRLQKHESSARNQEDIIKEFFKKTPEMTASECHKMYPDDNVPLTSIRRALSNLCRVEYLERTEEKRKGIYGRNEFVYKKL